MTTRWAAICSAGCSPSGWDATERQISAHLAEELVPERSALGIIFLAALLHDIGKPDHRQVLEDGRDQIPRA